ncbi:TonB-dependent receptor domain-containing protein (plasmid) [Falsihalocynthiibacter sp. SS001]|uniref:TonB-dependent receptor domain-containing protein n=1 Tax=Falsihalocynthiibacter sp. SS001 TaxID=3349698 RepID=UPI0036D2DFD1
MIERNGRVALVAVLATLPTSVTPAWSQDITDEGEFIGTVVLGESRRGVITNTATATTELNQEELDERQASTLSQLLDTVPGVTIVNGSTPQGSAINIRGLGSQAGSYGSDGMVSVVIDGVQKGQEEIYRSGGLLTMEPELFKQVKVTRGPGDGFRYSSGAIGGTIEAETKDAADFLIDGDTFAFRQKFGYESNGDGFLTTSILAWAPDDKLDVIAFGGYRSNGNRTDGSGVEQADTAFNLPSGLLKAEYKFSDELTLSGSISYTENDEKDVSYDAFSAAPFWGVVDRYTKDTTAYAALNYNPLDNDLIDLTAKFIFSDEQINLSSANISSDLYNSDHHTTRTAFLVENYASFASGGIDHYVTTGIEIGRRERSSLTDTGYNSVLAPGGTDDYVAFYATDEMTIGALTITPQMRYETQNLTSDNNLTTADGTEYSTDSVVGGISAFYQLNDNFAVFGTAAYNENMPLLDDLSNPLFITQTEKGVTYEAGVSYDGFGVFAANDALKFKITGFNTRIWDGTTYQFVDQTNLHGVELEMAYVNPAFYADFNASRTRGTINDTSDYFNYAPADRAILTLGKRFAEDQIDLSTEIVHGWANDRTSSTVGATAPSDSFTAVGFAASYIPNSGFAKDVEFRATVENAFNETYRPYLSTRNAIGRNFKLSVSKVF